jgi:hypothetical protein
MNLHSRLDLLNQIVHTAIAAAAILPQPRLDFSPTHVIER